MDVAGNGCLNKIFIMFYVFLYAIGRQNNKIIYVLVWEAAYVTPEFYKYSGRQYFIDRKCRFQNCFVTDNRSLLSNIMYYDVILFNSVILEQPDLQLPSARSTHQKYIFMSTEPVAMYPISKKYNGFFNFTFTYKLDSDVPWRYFVVRNKTSKKVIAPNKDVTWMDIDDMKPISEDIKRKLRSKNKAAAWYASHCSTVGKREDVIEKLKPALARYSLSLDIYGLCGLVGAPMCQYWNESCHIPIEINHYFYLAFENSMCEDYVTEKILTATEHYAIPIVLGGANYSRFVLFIEKSFFKQCLFVQLMYEYNP